MKVSEALKLARENAGYTQVQLAQAIGLSQSRIAEYETGARNPKYQTLQKISVALHTDVSSFLPAHGRKISSAEKKSGFISYPQICRDIFGYLTPMLRDTCTSSQLADIATAINRAYHAGRSSAGAYVDDCGSVWIDCLAALVDIDDIRVHIKEVERNEIRTNPNAR
jgi:transcriptional regulator with XRE-family HTH domain